MCFDTLRHSADFPRPQQGRLEKSWKKEKIHVLVIRNFSFLHNIFYSVKDNLHNFMALNEILSLANAFGFDRSII